MFSLNKQFSTKQNTTLTFIPYNQSEINALIAGFVEVADKCAYNGRYFIKNGKKWIHNLGALRKKLQNEYGRYIDDEELSASYPEGFGYDVETYYANNMTNSIRNNKEFKNLMECIRLN